MSFNSISQNSTKTMLINLGIAAATVTISVLALIYTTKFAGPLPISVSQTTTEKLSTFDVTGESEITTVPDQAEVSLGVTVNQSTVAAAQDQANQVINNISSELKSLGIKAEDIKTTNYSINPQYDFRETDRQITGYSVNANLGVKVKELDKVNQAIDIATRLGSHQVGGVQFTLSEEKEAQVKKEAREEAITEAKANALELSKLAGMRLGKIVNVTENNVSMPIPFAARGEMMALDSSAAIEPTQIEPGSTTFTYSVILSYETL